MDKRKRILRIRVNPVELQEIKKRQVGRQLSSWLRKLALGQPRKRLSAPAVDPSLLKEIAKLGNNINQIARWVNGYKDAADAVAVCSALIRIDFTLKKAVENVFRPNSEKKSA